MLNVLAWNTTSTIAAQDQAPPAKVVSAQPVLVSLDTLLDARVLAANGNPGAKTGKEKEAGKPKNEGFATLGLLTDLVLDLQTHRITHAAVQTDDGARAVPFGHLTYDAERRAWMLAGDKAMLAKARAWNAQRLDELHGPVADAGAKKERAGTTGDGEQREGATTKAGPEPSGRYALATVCARREIHAGGSKFATGLGFVFETSSNTLAFLRAAAADGDVAIPCPALTVHAAATPGAAPAFAVALGKEALAKAPRLGKEPGANLEERTFRAKVYEAFGVAPLAFDKSR